MAEFIAVFRMQGATNPSKTHYAADSVNAAINKLMSAANVASTMEFAEYELLEIVNEGKGYKIVAGKYDNQPEIASKALTVVPKEIQTVTEGIWVPHTIEVA